MNIKAIRSGCLAVSLVTAMNASGAFISDSFGVAHDYLGSGATGTVWDGFFYNLYAGGNATVFTADANASNAGRLTFRSTYGNWENGDDDGILLYRTVAGDFDAMVQIIDMNTVSWHDAGIMARVADLADAGAGEDWVAVKHFASANSNGHRSTDNGAGITVEAGTAQPWLRLTRTGDTFTSYRSTDGVTWSQISASTRTDMSGLAVQVGLWQATFSGNEGVAQLDNFSLRLPNAWSLGTGGSWTTAVNWTNGVPVGSADWAALSGALLGNGSVMLDGSQMIGRLTFDNAASYSIEAGSNVPASTLTINDTYEACGRDPRLDVKTGSHAITAPVVLSNGVTVATASGAGLTVSGGFSGNGPLTTTGAGMLTLSGTNTYSGATQVQGGTLKLASIPTGTRVYYTFDNSMNLGQDSSGMGNDVSVAWGAPSYAESGKFGGAVYLDGNSFFTRSVFPAGVPTGGNPYTIALWEKDDGSANTGGFVGWGNNAGGQCNNFRLAGPNALNNYWWGNDWELTGLSTNPKDGNWHHIAVTWDGWTQTMYVDGSPVGAIGRAGLNAQAANFVLGKTTADVNFKGWLDEVLIANRALAPSEITGLLSGSPNNILPVTTALQVAAGATLYLNGADQSVTALNGGGRVMNGTQANAALTVGSDNSSSAFSGTLDGAITLTKVGTGALTLSGVNAYSGGTFVDEGTLVLRPPSLQAVLAGSLAWYDASDAATLTTNESGQVALWANKGTAGAALNAVQITSGSGPTVLAGALNGRPVLSVDGTTALRTQNSVGISGAQDRTMFAVGCRKNNGTMCFAHIGEGSDNRAFGIISQPEFLFDYTWGFNKDILFPARPNDMYEIYDFMLSGSYGTANLISGGVLSSGALGLTPNTLDTQLSLGSRFEAAGQGNLAEVLLFNRALTLAERMGVEAYLRAKWFSADGSSTVSAGNVAVAAGAVLDLDGTTQTLSGLSGSGLVTNGTLDVSGDIAPGGTNAVGTLTLAAVAPQSGTLLIDAAPDGTSDLLAAQGALDLTGLALRIQDVSQLKAGQRYVIASCAPGGLTGPFASTNLEGGGWTVSFNNAVGQVLLISRGFLILIN